MSIFFRFSDRDKDKKKRKKEEFDDEIPKKKKKKGQQRFVFIIKLFIKEILLNKLNVNLYIKMKKTNNI